MNKQVIVIGILTILILGGIIWLSMAGLNKEEKDEPVLRINVEQSENVNQNEELTNRISHTIDITSMGFSPATLEINNGDIVTFINRDSESHWPASDVHPSHTAYPGSSISKCGSAEANRIFDACKDLNEGERYSFTFNEIGPWRYHDHRNPGMRGTIVVR